VQVINEINEVSKVKESNFGTKLLTIAIVVLFIIVFQLTPHL